MQIYISSDHGGFNLKSVLVKELKVRGFDVTDMGPETLIPDDDYPMYAFELAKKIVEQNNTDTIGILICRSGNGMVIAANKVKGARAALCFSRKHAQMARNDDGANIICLDADYEIGDSPIDIVLTFLQTKFAGWETRHGRRVKQIIDYENQGQ